MAGSEGVSDRFQALRLFVEIARTGSFSKGAKAMRLSQPTASRIIALLEEQLGTVLFSRSTRALTLTDPGSAYLARVQSILASLEEADDAVRGSDDMRGTLRVAVSSIFASRIIVPRLKSFVARHPNLQIELTIDDRRQDMILEGIDVAIRFGKLPDSTIIARLIGRWPLVVAAAPSYLDVRGIPGTPDALADHTFVIAGPVAGRELLFRQGDREVKVQPKGQVAIDGAEVAVSAVRAGVGIAVASLPSFSEDLDTGNLVQVLSDWKLAEIEAHALFGNGPAPKPAARAFVDHLVEQLHSF
ncbi:LysR family transcriptional regulator [Methylobacterium brachythecii]|uniref:DNA-binding transcriptional LysR family regulator n=1 Tax=Methylobacterium brachythecii TaxID=1176177 RepID=A0A7W6F7R4_9HYPH|nr:LysR family transcriptional regulator [Methylobacterium brachythecii]MBB3903665.1 DNA-binding transcriptional LysR family regulator [Methylobacterium brachythecii]GLS44236.1 LysR family transcriptional regulator [Methylobacterium brachythecii]